MKNSTEPTQKPLKLETKNLTLAYDKKIIIKNLSLTFSPEEITIIVGANGCGKSTLLQATARILKPKFGQILLNQQNLHKIPTKKLAQILGILPQQPSAPEEITVKDLVSRGRYPYQSWFINDSKTDEAAISKALQLTETENLANEPLTKLSGGQRQRAWIALALAQNPNILLLDEPTTFLDLSHQLDILDLLAKLNETEKTSIIMVLHDLNLAAKYAHKLVLIKEGEVLAQGNPQTVLTKQNIKQAFNLNVHISADPICGSVHIIPISKYKK